MTPVKLSQIRYEPSKPILRGRSFWSAAKFLLEWNSGMRFPLSAPHGFPILEPQAGRSEFIGFHMSIVYANSTAHTAIPVWACHGGILSTNDCIA